MATLLKNNQRNVFISSFLKRLPTLNNRTQTGIISIIPNQEINTWSESNWSEIGRQFNNFKRFPLPGQTGIQLNFEKNNNKTQVFDKVKIENLNSSLKNDPVVRAIFSLENTVSGFDLYEKMNNENMSKNTPVFELKAYSCPESLINDFQCHFRLNFDDSAMTLITISFKTENDMATWNNQVDEEREMVTEKFVEKAQEICRQIENEGYWADFVDPSTGSLHKSPYTHATFYETDERYRKFGYEIIDYGCCKVISHHEWGTKTYVGSILTNANVNGKFIKNLIN